MKKQCMLRMVCVIMALAASEGVMGVRRAEEGTDWETLIRDATQYATTPAKRAKKKAAREELFSRRAEALRELMERIHLQNIMLQVTAQELAEKLSAEEAVPVLLDFLESPHADTRRAAAFFLGFYKTPEHTEQLLPLLQDSEVAGAVIRTLGKWGARNAIEAIRSFLNHPREIRRIAAINALRDIGDPVAIPWIEPLLNDPIFTVRKTAARALDVLKRSADLTP